MSCSQSTCKLIWVIQKSAQARSMYEFGIKVNDLYRSPYRSQLLLKHAQHTRYVIKVLLYIFLFSFAIFSAYPIYDLLKNSHYTLFLAIYIPNVDPHETYGFCINVAVQFIMAVYWAAGNLTMDLIMAHLVLNYCTFVTVLQWQLLKLVRLYEKPKTPQSITHRNRFFRNLLKQVSDTYK